jgi:hypothetical protein
MINKLTPVKDRTLVAGQIVEVYFNLHKKVFSIKDVKTGLVVAHTPIVNLYNAGFKVSEAGRQRVIKEQRKNVHARVVGAYVPLYDGEGVYLKAPHNMKQAYYNPYKVSTFVDKDTQQPIHGASVVYCVDKQVLYI